MKAAIYQGNRTFVTGVSEPVGPGAGQVRLNVAYCGVCGTDVHIFHGVMDKRVGPPQIIGHEASAEVAEIGEGVEGVSIGDRVAVRPLQFGEPTPFDKGCPHVGKNLKFIGIDTPGAMQGSWTVPAYTLHKLPTSLSLEHGALIEPVAVACHDVRLGGICPNENCVVLGGGPIGLLIALVARQKGARVLVSEVNPARIELARSLGLEAVNPAEQDLIREVASWSGDAMADAVFEVSGSAPAVEIMTELLNVRGRIVMVAIHSAPKPVNLFRFFWSEIRMIGARLYEAEDFDEAIRFAADGVLPLDALITRIDPIEATQQVFETIDANPQGMKYLIQCGQ
ncbi:MAG: alcohol dehydrogenase catalytic domain-containing protein [Planctomycetaceae bacterium]|nr:alcohol dehydrogenase catalytic domain-containing protein [Planctomycetaceae bacterium]